MKVNIIYYISLFDKTLAAPFSIFDLNKVGTLQIPSKNSASPQGLTDRKPDSTSASNHNYEDFVGEECALTTDLNVQFITKTLAPSYFAATKKEKVDFRGRQVDSFKLFTRMVTRLAEPFFTKSRRRQIHGPSVDCDLIDGFDMADSAAELLTALDRVIEAKLTGAKIYNLWRERLAALRTTIGNDEHDLVH